MSKEVSFIFFEFDSMSRLIGVTIVIVIIAFSISGPNRLDQEALFAIWSLTGLGRKSLSRGSRFLIRFLYD